MPSYYDLPAITQTGVEDIDHFNKLPFYLVKNEVKQFPEWDDFTRIFGDITWIPNMGDTMKGVRPEVSPVGNALFYPNRINTDPNKSVFDNNETTETMVLRWHDYQSRMFSFVPSWQDFRDNQLNFRHKDIIRQIGIGNNLFVRTAIWDYSPNIYRAGRPLGEELTEGCPDGAGNTAQTAAGSKTSAWLAEQLAGVSAPLSWRVIKNASSIFTEDLNVPYFEGMKNMPKPDERLKGKHILYGSNDAWLNLTDDPDVIARRNKNSDELLTNDFKGLLGNGTVLYKSQRFPKRCNEDGVLIAPQKIDAATGKTRPNRDYVNARFECAYMFGADAYRTVKVGPPPRDFTGMSKDKFYSMKWNGELRVTDQFTIIRGTIAGGDYDVQLNDDGRFLKLKGTTIHGIMPGERFNALPIWFVRSRHSGAV